VDILQAVHKDETTTKEIHDDGEIIDLPQDYSVKTEILHEVKPEGQGTIDIDEIEKHIV
jgi:hypothetical protein